MLVSRNTAATHTFGRLASIKSDNVSQIVEESSKDHLFVFGIVFFGKCSSLFRVQLDINWLSNIV